MSWVLLLATLCPARRAAWQHRGGRPALQAHALQQQGCQAGAARLGAKLGSGREGQLAAQAQAGWAALRTRRLGRAAGQRPQLPACRCCRHLLPQRQVSRRDDAALQGLGKLGWV